MVSENQRNFRLSQRPAFEGQIMTDGNAVYTASEGKWYYRPSTKVGPDYTENLLDWWKADDGLLPTVNGATITSWSDRGSNLNHLLAVVSTPQYYENIQNGLPAAYFDGVNETVYGANKVDDAQPHTSFIVFKPTAWGTGTYQAVWNMYSAGPGLWKATGTTATNVYYGAHVQGDPIANGTTHLFTAVSNGASSTNQVNNNTPTTGNPGTATNPNYPFLGTYDGALYDYTGYIMEIRVYSGVMSAANQAIVQAALNRKWGIF